MILEQQKREVKIFSRATIEILTTANIKTSVFNQSVELYLMHNLESMLTSAKLSLYTPFAIPEQHESISKEKATKMLKEASKKAVDLLRSEQLIEQIHNECELLLIYDSLFQDSIFATHQITGDQFRAIAF